MSNQRKKIVALTLIPVVVGGSLAWAAMVNEGRVVQIPAVAIARAAVIHSVEIRRPTGIPQVHTGLTNYHGELVNVSCNSCHATTTPNFETHTTAELTEFHQGLKFAHGDLSCLSCHSAKNYESLHLANGREVPFPDVMTLCAQCHGPQTRDYNNGSHGGMTGYWDLTKGPRQRNNCINCHDPHSPAYPIAMPVFAPKPAKNTPAH